MQKIILFLGVAALCFSANMVEAKPGDLLHSLFKEQSEQLSAPKPAESAPITAVLLASQPASKYSCKADDVVNSGSQLLKDTIDIMTDTFTIIYKAMFLTSDCQNNKFKCFFEEFSSTKDMFVDVKTKVMNYAVNAQTLTGGISYYFTDCKRQ